MHFRIDLLSFDLHVRYIFFVGTAIEDLTTIASSGELLDVEDEISSPVTTATNNGNTDANPVRESSTFISSQINGVRLSYLLRCLILISSEIIGTRIRG